MSPVQPAYPHEKRVQRHAYLALAAATALAVVVALRGDATLGAVELPALAPPLLALAGAAAGAVAVHRRAPALALAAAGALALAVLPGGSPRPGLLDLALGLPFAVALLAFGELVHMARRYEHAHRAVEKEGVPEEHVNRVTDEALRTLATRGALAGALVAAGALLAFLLSVLGPRQWRAAVETTAPVGVAVATLAILGALSLFILARGADYRLPRREATPPEATNDVAD